MSGSKIGCKPRAAEGLVESHAQSTDGRLGVLSLLEPLLVFQPLLSRKHRYRIGDGRKGWKPGARKLQIHRGGGIHDGRKIANGLNSHLYKL